MDSAPAERRLGDYLLKQRLAETPLITTWLAEQVSVHRMVLVDELDPQRASRSAAFLADIRAKASVDHPLIGTVYEAVIERNLCFYAHELLPGATLDERKAAGESFAPVRAVSVLRRVAEANLHQESRDHATSLLTLDAIHLDEQGVVRVKNLVVAGSRTPKQSYRDIGRIGETFPPLVAHDKPGTNRVLTLLSWMRGDGIPEPIGWHQVREYCQQIEQQLSDPEPASSTKGRHFARPVWKRPVVIIGVGTALAIAAIVGVAMKVRPLPPPPPARAALPAPVSIPQGTAATPDGGEESHPAFRISAYEVTIEEYSRFLDDLAVLVGTPSEHVYDHPDQPASKAGHEPDLWLTLKGAAKTGGLWQGRPVALDTPVVGVDWWDAFAYTQWSRSRLPSQDEWFAALPKSAARPAALKAGNWIPVTASTSDRTENGLLGMAGSVSEWTREPATNPANPLGAALWVIIGGSYMNPANGALTREWTENRGLRRPDLGFRVIQDPD